MTEDISDRLASTVEPGSSLNISSPSVSLTLMKRVARQTGSDSSVWTGEGGDCSVRLPDQEAVVNRGDSSITISFTQYNKLAKSLSQPDTEVC